MAELAALGQTQFEVPLPEGVEEQNQVFALDELSNEIENFTIDDEDDEQADVEDI